MSGLVASCALAAARRLAGDRPAAAPEPAAQLYPIDLRVAGGEDTWHADNDFRLDWDRPPIADQGFPVSAVHSGFATRPGAWSSPRPGCPGTDPDRTHPPPRVPGATPPSLAGGPEGAPAARSARRCASTTSRPGRSAARPDRVDRRRRRRDREDRAPAGAAADLRHPRLRRLGRPRRRKPALRRARSLQRRRDRPPRRHRRRHHLARAPPGGVNVVRASPSPARDTARRRSAARSSGSTRPAPGEPGRGAAGWANGPVRLTAGQRRALGDGGERSRRALHGDRRRRRRAEAGAGRRGGDHGQRRGSARVAGFARDAAGNWSDGSPAGHGRDRRKPARSRLRQAQDPAEPELIEATVADALSGPTRAGSIAVRPAGSRQRSRRCRPRCTGVDWSPAGTPTPSRPEPTSSGRPATTRPATRPARSAATTGPGWS